MAPESDDVDVASKSTEELSCCSVSVYITRLSGEQCIVQVSPGVDAFDQCLSAASRLTGAVRSRVSLWWGATQLAPEHTPALCATSPAYHHLTVHVMPP